MGLFESKDLETFDAYKKKRTANLKKLGSTPSKFFFADRYKFGDNKTLPLFVFDNKKIEPALLTTLKKATSSATTAEGSCFLDKEGTLIFRVAKGEIKGFNMVDKWQVGEAIAQDINVGDNKVDIAAQKQVEWKSIYDRAKKNLTTGKKELSELEARVKEAVTKYAEALAAFKGDKDDATLKQAKEEAQTVKLEAQRAVQDKNKQIKLIEGMLQAVDKAQSDADKAEVLFEKGKYQMAVVALKDSAYRSMMATDDAIMVLGRTVDTWKLQLSDDEQGRTLAVDPDKYSLTANDAFMKGGIDIKARFQMVTALSATSIKVLKHKGITSAKLLEYVDKARDKEPGLWNKNRQEPAVSCREICQLLDDGYWFSLHPKDHKKPEGEMIQMMFPRALKPAVHEELLRKFEEAAKK